MSILLSESAISGFFNCLDDYDPNSLDYTDNSTKTISSIDVDLVNLLLKHYPNKVVITLVETEQDELPAGEHIIRRSVQLVDMCGTNIMNICWLKKTDNKFIGYIEFDFCDQYGTPIEGEIKMSKQNDKITVEDIQVKY